jgi:hypothetical protein
MLCLAAPFFVLMGNLAFIAGTAFGFIAGRGFTSRR